MGRTCIPMAILLRDPLLGLVDDEAAARRSRTTVEQARAAREAAADGACPDDYAPAAYRVACDPRARREPLEVLSRRYGVSRTVAWIGAIAAGRPRDLGRDDVMRRMLADPRVLRGTLTELAAAHGCSRTAAGYARDAASIMAIRGWVHE